MEEIFIMERLAEYSPMVIAIFIAITPFIRIGSSYDDLFKFNPPLWLRRLLFVVNVPCEKISIATIICQATTNILFVLLVLYWRGWCVFYHVFGIYVNVALLISIVWLPIGILTMVIYRGICQEIMQKRADDELFGRKK